MSKKKKEKKVEKEFEPKELKGSCLSCGKKMGRNIQKCSSCKRKNKLKRKANKRGKPKNYYLEGKYE